MDVRSSVIPYCRDLRETIQRVAFVGEQGREHRADVTATRDIHELLAALLERLQQPVI